MDTELLVTHDPVRGLSYIYLAGKTPPGGAYRTLVAAPDIYLDFDRYGRLIGIELLSGELLHPTLKAIAVAPGSTPHE